MPWHVNNRAAILRERIDFEREHRLDIGIDPHRQSMRHAIGLAAHGATHIRSHVDIDPVHGLSLVEGVWQTREKLRGVIDIEIVAFPQSGLMVMPGTKELLDEALRQGCEVLAASIRAASTAIRRDSSTFCSRSPPSMACRSTFICMRRAISAPSPWNSSSSAPAPTAWKAR